MACSYLDQFDRLPGCCQEENVKLAATVALENPSFERNVERWHISYSWFFVVFETAVNCPVKGWTEISFLVS